MQQYPIPEFNDFGASILGVGNFQARLGEVLQGVEGEDADGDGFSNIEELRAGTHPGVSSSMPLGPLQMTSDVPNPRWEIGQWSGEFALRRVMLRFCGHGPSYDEAAAIREEGRGGAEDRVRQALRGCLRSDFWRKNALRRLADKRITPFYAIGWDSPQVNGRRIRLADYEWDYRLFEWALTGGRNMQDLLTADYFVRVGAGGELEKLVSEAPLDTDQGGDGGSGPQRLPRNRRAGMLSSAWFLMINTMFTPLPRTSAAQAYRAYLGQDISKLQGIRPVAGEPLNLDGALNPQGGAIEPACAACHTTLDAAAYAFAPYNGIGGNGGTGAYDPARPAGLISGWSSTATSTVLGEQVDDLPDWARTAADSDNFRVAMATMLFEYATGHAPGPEDWDEFEILWRSLEANGHSADDFLERLVLTDAFGAVR